MSYTAIPAIKKAILEILEEAESLQDIQVTGDKEPERAAEYVWLFKTEADREPALIGPQPVKLNENVKALLRVVAIKGTATTEPSEERAFEIAQAVEEALAADIGLKDTALYHWVSGLSPEPVMFDQKRGCHVLMTVTAKARI